MREDVASSTHSTGRLGVRLTPATKPQADPSIDFRLPSDEGKDMKDHIIPNKCSKFVEDIIKLEHLPSMKRFGKCS